MSQSREQLLEMHGALPEAYQPAWGLLETTALAQRACEDRFVVLLAALKAFPGKATLRILDIGCAQGYFSVGLEAELGRLGRRVEIVGVDSLADNVRFCAELAAHHGARARFIHDRFDDGFLERHALADFDVVLALNVLHHVRELAGANVAEAALADVRAHSAALFCELAQREEQLEWISEWHASDDALLRGYVFRRCLGTFGTHLGEVQRPLYVCSNRFAYVGAQWFPFERVLDRAHPGVSDGFAGQRRFFIGPEFVVKSCRSVGDFGAFNRAELAAEAEVLNALPDEPSRYPRLLAQTDDGDEVWLARGALPGVLVSELIETGAGFDRELLVRALLGELAHLQERGYHHADLRAWNMLWRDGELRLIDFGSMTREASPLHRLALAAVLAEIARGELSNEQAWYESVHPLEAYPPIWRPLVGYVLLQPQAVFSFSEASTLLDASVVDGNVADACGPTSVAPEVLRASILAHVEGFARLRAHAEEAVRLHGNAESHAADLEKALKRQGEEAGVYVADLKKTLRRQGEEAEVYARELRSQLQRQTADADQERAASQAAMAEAAAYARSLEVEREALKREVKNLHSELDLLRKRFRLLKPLWPRHGEHET